MQILAKYEWNACIPVQNHANHGDMYDECSHS